MREIPLTQGYAALVDDEDFDLVNQFKWMVHRAKQGKHHYAVRHEYLGGGRLHARRRLMFMHRLILGSAPRTNVLHVDGDGLNNTRANLVPGVNFHESYIVNPVTGCWEWQRLRKGFGYGWMTFRGEAWAAHRVSYVIHNRREIPPGLVVMHSCDNPCCVNPAHLSLGTSSDNALDCVMKGRRESPTTKLTPEDVLSIRTDVRPPRIVAAEYGITKSHVWAVKTGKSWKEISNV